MTRCIYCGAETDAVGGGCARCNRLRSLPEDWTPRTEPQDQSTTALGLTI